MLVFKRLRHFVSITVAVALLCKYVVLVQAANYNSEDIMKSVERLGLDVPLHLAMREAVARRLDELRREPCDQKAIVGLANALEHEGYRREGAKAHIKFSELCGGHAPSLRAAANILLDLSDNVGAASVASSLIDMEPFNNNGYFLRAVAYEKAGLSQKAINDYTTAIELFGDKDHISSAGYEGLARSYDKLGRYCDAAASIETWVASNPARRETSQSRMMISSYRSKGSCAVGAGPKEEVFAISHPNHVVTLQATINEVRGNFILDTGATFVALKSSFAQKAKVDVDQDSSIKMNTANGLVDAKSGRAKSIRLRSLQAQDVAVVVQADSKGLYGENVDGLLGMSFLSRFKVAIDAHTVKVKKNGAP